MCYIPTGVIQKHVVLTKCIYYNVALKKRFVMLKKHKLSSGLRYWQERIGEHKTLTKDLCILLHVTVMLAGSAVTRFQVTSVSISSFWLNYIELED